MTEPARVYTYNRPATEPGPHPLSGQSTARAGHVHLQPAPDDEGPRYAVTLVTAGRVRQADGDDSNWLIPAKVLEQAVLEGRFDALPHYVDHPDMFGFGWRQSPSVRDLAGVATRARWDPQSQSVTATLRLYDTEAGQLLRLLYDQIIADAEAGGAIPPMGLSLVCYRDYELDEQSGLKVWTSIKKVSSVDAVYSPGAAGYIRAALSTIAAGAHHPRVATPAECPSSAHPALSNAAAAQLPDARGSALAECPPSAHPALSNAAAAQLPDARGSALAECPPFRHSALSEATSSIEGGTMSETPNPQNAQPTQQAIHNPAPAVHAGATPNAATPAPSPSLRAEGEAISSPTPQSRPRESIPRDEGATDEAISSLRAEVQSLNNVVTQLTASLAVREEGRTVEGMGEAPRTPQLFGGFSGLDRVSLAVDALLSGTRPPEGVRPLTGIRELYMLLSGDYELTGRFHPDRVYLANVTTSTMAGLVANRLNKVVVNMFQEYDQWWAPAVTVRDFSTLQDVRWITLGGVGELPTVAEGAAYTEMTWDDQTETDSFVKKGGYLGITLETIDKDDTARVMAAPRALAQAAWLTLGKAIAEVFTANSGYGPAMSDSNYLIDDSNHSNYGTTALSFSAWETTKIAMMKFTEVNSSERLGALTRPRLLWVPIDLENTAIEVLAAGEGHPNDADYRVNAEATATDLMARLNSARNRVITCPFWTDTADWVAQADPRMYPGLGLGFRYGRTPEIFSVADPRAGLMFTNDTMPIKVRFFFAVGPTDWRAFYKHLVS